MTTHKQLADEAREEAARLVRLIAEPRAPGERIKVSITRAAARLGWSYRRTEDIWRMEARRIDSWQMDLMRRLVGKRCSRDSGPRY
jgi:hypothetical protein